MATCQIDKYLMGGSYLIAGREERQSGNVELQNGWLTR